MKQLSEASENREAKLTCRLGLVWVKVWFRGDLTSKKLETLNSLYTVYKLITYSITYGSELSRHHSPLRTLVRPMSCSSSLPLSLGFAPLLMHLWTHCCSLCTQLCSYWLHCCPLCMCLYSPWQLLCSLSLITCRQWLVVLALISTCHQPSIVLLRLLLWCLSRVQWLIILLFRYLVPWQVWSFLALT
jgi:hypothetical protein